MRPTTAASILTLAACSAQRAPAVTPAPVVHVNPPAAVTALPAEPWTRLVALERERYRATGTARPIDVNGFTVFPYGHGHAELACGVLRVCVVQLAPGETLTVPPIVSDTARWAVRVVREGDGNHAPVAIVQVKYCDLAANLVLVTEGRVYRLLLDSPACDAKRENFTARSSPATHVAFYYPDESGVPGPAPTLVHAPRRAPASAPMVVNRAYVVKADKAIAWRPSLVYDDGTRTVIELPAAARREALPVLYGLAEDGSREVVKYTVMGSTYTADRVFRAAALVVRSGKAERVVRIENRGPSRPGGAS